LPDNATRICPSDPQTRLRAATAADEDFVRHLFKTVRAGQFAAANLSAELLDILLDQQFRAQTAGYAAQFPHAESMIVTQAEISVGRLIVHTDRECWHIVDIALMPAVRGRGLGTDVIEAVARAAAGAAARELSLSVLSGNIAARRLYARLGFTAIGDDAYITMTRPLAPGQVTATARSPSGNPPRRR
jgi:ribosomal protein S18 acetylase RimI-like enzyme